MTRSILCCIYLNVRHRKAFLSTVFTHFVPKRRRVPTLYALFFYTLWLTCLKSQMYIMFINLIMIKIKKRVNKRSFFCQKKISQWHLLTGLGGRQTKEFFFLYIQWYFGVCHFGVHFWHLVSDLSFKNYCIILKTYRQTWKTKNKKTSSEVSHTVSQSLLSFTTLSSLTKTAQHEQSDDETTDGCVRCRQWNDKTALALEKKKLNLLICISALQYW